MNKRKLELPSIETDIKRSRKSTSNKTEYLVLVQ